MVAIVVEDGTGAAGANAYASVAEVRDYFAVVPDAATFLALNDDALGGYIVYATRVLDQKTMWKGYRTTTTQSLDWPRTYAYDKYDQPIATDVVPEQVKAVTAELARWLQNNDPADGQDVTNLKQITVDVVELIFQDQTTQTNWPTLFNQILEGLGKFQVGSRGFPRVIKA